MVILSSTKIDAAALLTEIPSGSLSQGIWGNGQCNAVTTTPNVWYVHFPLHWQPL